MLPDKVDDDIAALIGFNAIRYKLILLLAAVL